MMLMPRVSFPHALAGLASLGLTGCSIQAPNYDDVLAADEANRAQSTSSGAESTNTGDASTGGEPGSTSSGSSGHSLDLGGGETTAHPPQPDPVVDEVELHPGLVEKAGDIAVLVNASDADGVRMQVYDAPAVELVPGIGGTFTGAIPVLTGLLNGAHKVTFTPWRGDLEGESKTDGFVVALPPPGSQSAWDASGDLGEGQVAAVAVTKAGEFYEFGTLTAGSQCYLRRRTLAAALTDLQPQFVLEGYTCKAISVAAAPDGRLYMLAERVVMGEPLWWLGRMDQWGLEATQLKTGALGEKAYALAMRPDGGEVAVCGTGLGGMKDLDMRVAVYREGNSQLDESKDWDPTGGKNEPHLFNETPYDCAYRGERLILGGAIFGQHPGEVLDRERMFTALFHTVSGNVTWAVADVGEGIQSGLTGLTVTSDGYLVAVGYTCGEACTPLPRLRMYDPDGGLVFKIDLDSTLLTPLDVAWSPAGYAIVATSRLTGPWKSTFVLQAWTPGLYAPAWTFEHADQPVLHVAQSIALAPEGVAPWAIFAGGRGGAGVPAVAVVSP